VNRENRIRADYVHDSIVPIRRMSMASAPLGDITAAASPSASASITTGLEFAELRVRCSVRRQLLTRAKATASSLE
jgi:hypothetical protein